MMKALIIVAVILLLLLLATLIIYSLTKKNTGSSDSLPGHDHSKGASNCPACQAANKPVKVKIPMACSVYFRPTTAWKGEFGFDWLRIGDIGEKPYKDVIEGGYKSTDALGNVIEFTKAEAYAAIKNEYKTIATEIKDKPDDLKEYYVPYLNLYPKDTVGTPGPPSQAELRILIAVEKTEPDKIEFEYDNTLFSIEKKGLNDKAIGPKREATDKTIKITCLKEFAVDQEINVWAYPKGATDKADATLAGKIIACANDASKRKELKFVLVKVKTNIEGTENKGRFMTVSKDNLTNALHQALIHGVLEDGPDLDLTADPNLRIITNAAGGKTIGMFIKKTAKGILDEDNATDFFAYTKNAFSNIASNAKYNGYFTVFSYGEQGYDAAQGQIHSINNVFQKNLILFNVRDTTTLNHEALHGLKLQHTHRDNAPEPSRKYTFVKHETDNVMSYVPLGISTWRWQWELMRNSI